MSLNEADTRLQFIDPAMQAVGWLNGGNVRVRLEYPITAGRLIGGGKRGSSLKADFVLEYKGKKLAVVEAKRYDANYTEGLSQAKDYAKRLQVRFALCTNGQKIYMVDLETGKEGDIDAYPSPEEFWEMTFAEASEWRERFGEVPFETKGGLWDTRYYQDIAVDRVLEGLVEGRKRMLLTLATGTGKTSIAFQIVWKLFQTRWNLKGDGGQRPRVLFLADRNGLADQAYNEFSAFAEDARVRIDPESISKKGAVPKNGNIFFTIFQTFMAGKNGEPNFGGYPPDFFDFIIVDECHRGGSADESSWRGILEYFEPAVQLGLTATPKRKDNADTYKYFGEPVFTYSLKDGIEDGFLTPFRVRVIDTTLDDYVFDPSDEVLAGEIDPDWIYEEKDFNTKIEIVARERYRVKVLLDEINQNDKTIVFCASQGHALLVRDLINQLKSNSNPDYCQRVTADEGALGDKYLRQFQDNEKTIPTILTTSQKLSTGVNAMNIRNIVLLRKVDSMIEFKQIIGRGTRLFEGKDYFTIIDFVDAYKNFSDPEWDGEPVEPVAKPEKPKKPGPPGSDDGELGGDDDDGSPKKEKIVVKLGGGKERLIQHTAKTLFYGPGGKTMSASEFIKSLFDTLTLPDFFETEEKLREIWSNPTTRRALLQRLEDAGFNREGLTAIQEMIEAKDSDLFDVLEFVAFDATPITRAKRAEVSRLTLVEELSAEQMEFIDFVLSKYVESGPDELDDLKLPTLLELKYTDLFKGLDALGGEDEARDVFIDFQEHLYKPASEYELVTA